MKLGKLAWLPVSLAMALPALAVTHTRRAPASAKPAIKHVSKPKFQPPRGIEDSRAVELQNALVRSGYLTGDPSGHWDAASEAAMQKLQGDNGWQTKLVPDSRAIIKLGLGPSTAYTPTGFGAADGAATPAAPSGPLAR